MKQIAIFITIPFVLATPPVMGWLIGKWLDEKFHTEPYLMYLMIMMGFIAGFREVFRLVRRYADENE